MDAIIITTLDKVAGIQINELQRYLFIIIPIIGVLALVTLRNRQDVFIRSMISMILIASITYFVFFGIFLSKTYDYLPMFINKMSALSIVPARERIV